MQSDFSESRANERQRDITPAKSCYRNAQTNASVRKHEAARDCDLGKYIFCYYIFYYIFFMKVLYDFLIYITNRYCLYIFTNRTCL